MCLLIFSTIFIGTFFIIVTKKCGRYYHKCTGVLVSPTRKEKVNVSVRTAWISCGTLLCGKINMMTTRISILLKTRTSLTYFRASSLPGRAKDLSAPRYIGLRVKYPIFLLGFNKTWIFWLIFERASNITFHGNPSNGSRVVPCGQADRYDGADNRSSKFCENA